MIHRRNGLMGLKLGNILLREGVISGHTQIRIVLVESAKPRNCCQGLFVGYFGRDASLARVDDNGVTADRFRPSIFDAGQCLADWRGKLLTFGETRREWGFWLFLW